MRNITIICSDALDQSLHFEDLVSFQGLRVFISNPNYRFNRAGIAQSVLRHATGWTVRGSNPGGGVRFSASVQTDPGAHPASCTMGTGSFQGVKRPGRGADHPPPSKCRGQERVGLYLYSPSGPSWPVMGELSLF